MKLTLATPESWRAMLSIEVKGIGPLPDDPLPAVRAQMAEGEVISEREIATASGWPALVFEWRVTRGGETVRKLLYLLQVLEYGGVITVSAPEEIYRRHEDEVLAVLSRAEVEWDEQPLTLAAIWQGFDPSV